MLKLQVPFSLLLSGASGSGKTQFTYDLLKADRTAGIFSAPFSKVIYSYSSYQPIYDKMAQLYESSDQFVVTSEIPWDQIENMNGETNVLLIIDDQMLEQANNAKISNIFTRGRHSGLSCIFSLQNLYQQGSIMKNVTRNATYICLFRQPRDISILTTLNYQAFPNHKNFLQSAYTDVHSQPYQHLWLDMSPGLDDERLRVRSKILDLNASLVYLPKH